MSSKRIAIIGAGPIGIEAAVYARSVGNYEPILYDRGDVAESVQSWGFIQLFSPWKMDASPLGKRMLRSAGAWAQEPDAELRPTGHEFRQTYLLPLVKIANLADSIHLQNTVVTLGKDDLSTTSAPNPSDSTCSPFRILVTDDKGRERIDQADIVLDCSGTYGHHRWAGRGGIPAPGELVLQHRTWYTIPDVLGRHRERFANRHTLLLGCGFSAATVLESIQQLQKEFPETRLTWAMRRPGQALQALHGDPLPARRQLVQKAIELANSPPPWLQFLGTCVMESMEPGTRASVTLRSMQTSLVLAVDEVVALVGYMPDTEIEEQLQIHQCYASGGPIRIPDRAGAGSEPDKSSPSPNFFILGAKSYGTNSNFLLQIGHHQIVEAFRLLNNDPTLNLYDVGG